MESPQSPQRAQSMADGTPAKQFTLTEGAWTESEAARFLGISSGGLRKWRNKASIDALSGRIVVDDATGALVRCDLTAKFATAEEPKPVTGTVEVHTVLTDVASTAAIEKPPAEDLAMRQRTQPEQRELLRGLGQVRPVAEPARPGGRPKAVSPGAQAAPGRPGPAKTASPKE